MHKKSAALPWHKLSTRKQNWIVISLGAVISLLIIGILTLIQM